MELNLSKIIKEIYKTHKFKIIALGIVIVLIICLVFYGGQIHKAKEETRKGLVENSNLQMQEQNTYNKKIEDKNPSGKVYFFRYEDCIVRIFSNCSLDT